MSDIEGMLKGMESQVKSMTEDLSGSIKQFSDLMQPLKKTVEKRVVLKTGTIVELSGNSVTFHFENANRASEYFETLEPNAG